MKDTELAYIAGIIDGEGGFAITGKNLQTVCRVAMVDFGAISYLQGVYPGNVSIVKRSNPRHHACFVWQIGDMKLTPFLEELIPYLKVKGPQAMVMLAIRYLKESRHRTSRRMPAWVWQYYKDCKQLLSLQNLHKGVPGDLEWRVYEPAATTEREGTHYFQEWVKRQADLQGRKSAEVAEMTTRPSPQRFQLHFLEVGNNTAVAG